MNKETMRRIRKIAFFMAILMLLGACPLTVFADGDDTLYYATFNPELESEGYLPYKLLDESTLELEEWYSDADNWSELYGTYESKVNYLPHTVFEATTLIVRKLYYQGEYSGYVYVTNEDWNPDFDACRVFSASEDASEWCDLVIGEVYDPDVTKIEGTLGSFSASVEGSTVPADAKLHIGEIAEEDLDSGIVERRDPVNMKKFLGAFDLKIMQGETEWQPDGEKVTVTMNAAALGLYTGQTVFIIHMHQNADGSKEYEILGPLVTLEGVVSFKIDKFSDFAVYQGNGAIALKEDSTIYVEPGSVVALGGYVKLLFAGTQLVNAKYSTGTDKDGISHGEVSASAVCGESSENATTMTIIVSAEATIGATNEYTVVCSGPISSQEYKVKVIVGTRAQVTEVALNNYPMLISLRKPYSDGSFPSEPSTSEYSQDYYFLLQNGGSTDTTTDFSQKNDNVIATFDGVTDYYYATKASSFLDATAMGQSYKWMKDVAGNAIGGVVDPTGYETKACFKSGTITWNDIAQRIAAYNDGIITAANLEPATATADQIAALASLVFVRYQQEDANSDTGFTEYAIALTEAAGKTIASYGDEGVSNYALVYYSEFELIPYIIKLMPATIESSGWFNTSSDSVWHVDLALVRGDAYTLGYDLNLGKDIVTKTNVALPNARVFIEDPTDNDTCLTYTFVAADLPSSPTFPTLTVQAADDATLTTTATFLGWSETNTWTEGDTLYGPTTKDFTNATANSITMYGDVTLYAIWQLEEAITPFSRSFSIVNKIELAPGSPVGAAVPITDRLDFTISFAEPINLAATSGDSGVAADIVGVKLKEAYIQANLFNASGTLTAMPATPITLADLYADGSKLSAVTFNKTADGTAVQSLSISLAKGESVSFIEVPGITNAELEKYNTYTISESISTDLQEHYSVDNAGTVFEATQTVTLSNIQTGDALATFSNYYHPPVAGLMISATGGDDGEYFIFYITADVLENPIIVSVQNGSSVTVANLLAGEYEVTTNVAWNPLSDPDKESNTITLTEGIVNPVTFNYSQSGQWLYDYGGSAAIAVTTATN